MKPKSGNPGEFGETTLPWTSRRRLQVALSGGVPDRVPINTYELAGRNSLDWYNQQPKKPGQNQAPGRPTSVAGQ